MAQRVVDQVRRQAFDQALVALQADWLQVGPDAHASGRRLGLTCLQHACNQRRELDGLALERATLDARQRHERVDQLLLLLPRSKDPLMCRPQRFGGGVGIGKSHLTQCALAGERSAQLV